MPSPASLSALFGANATQDANTVTISKADLAGVGLTASASIPAERIMAALILKAQAGQDASTDAYFQVSTQDQFLVTRNTILYRRYRYVLDFYVPEQTTALDPNKVQ